MELYVSARKGLGPFEFTAQFTASGERVGIFGDSGSGKTTLVNLLAGLMEPDTGEISLDGEMLYSSRQNISLPTEKRRIAIVFQDPHLFPHMSVEKNLLYGFRRCAPGNRSIDPRALVEVLRLGDLLSRGVNRLSGGEKQRVAIGRAVLSNPRLLLMDEPLSALDEELKYQIIFYLKSVCERFRIPFLFISHSVVEMQLMTDSVLVFEKGKLLDQTTSDQLARNRMQHSYVGYINLLKLGGGRAVGGLHAFRWGAGELLISSARDMRESVFELSSRDIILFKKHPEAISARNLLKCCVLGTFEAGNRVGVELQFGTGRLVAEVVRQAADELQIRAGVEVYAAIKASAFRERGGAG